MSISTPFLLVLFKKHQWLLMSTSLCRLSSPLSSDLPYLPNLVSMVVLPLHLPFCSHQPTLTRLTDALNLHLYCLLHLKRPMSFHLFNSYLSVEPSSDPSASLIPPNLIFFPSHESLPALTSLMVGGGALRLL